MRVSEEEEKEEEEGSVRDGVLTCSSSEAAGPEPPIFILAPVIFVLLAGHFVKAPPLPHISCE